MRLSLICLLWWAGSAFAQTTTWNPTDKSADITLSNGNLTAQSSAKGSFKTVRATVGKFSGKWCYQFTVNNPISSGSGQGLSIGFANVDWPLAPGNNNGLGTSDGVRQQSASSAGLLSNGNFNWHELVTAMSPPVVGATGEVCVNLDPSPPRVWVTPDVTGMSGAGGGPRWNGNATANPVTNVGGVMVFIPRYTWFPAFSGSVNDKLSANFGPFTPPRGFSTWNTAGGGEPTPGPHSPLVINVANAPEWQASHSYAVKDRVLAGPAWSGGAYTNGLDVCLWAVKVGGTSGASPAAFNAACSTGTPANHGGGLDGTTPVQWNSATTVTDGGVTWVLLSKIDYPTLTSAFIDDAQAWAPNTMYAFNQTVVLGANSYVNRTGYGGTPTACTSGSSWSGSGPDNTCNWGPTGTIPYTSQVHRWPHLKMSASNFQFGIMQTDYNIKVNVWYGGAQRIRYEAGVSNESLPIPVRDHISLVGMDQYTFCYKWDDFGRSIDPGFDAIACNGTDGFFLATLSPASGDGFADNPGPLRYDETRGVSLYTQTDDTNNNGDWYHEDQPIAVIDYGSTIKGFQVKSEYGTAFHAGFSVTEIGNIFDAGGAEVIGGCCEGKLVNNVLISRSTAPGTMAVFQKYHTSMNQNTAIGMGAVDSTFFGAQLPNWNTPTPGRTVKNNLVFGFAYPYGRGDTHYSGNPSLGYASEETWSVWRNGGNAGDAVSPIPDHRYSDLAAPNGWVPWETQFIPGFDSVCGAGNNSPCTGLSAADVFINPTIGPNLDLRLKPNAPVLGAGVASDTRDGLPNDIFGTGRPQGGRYDVGAYQLPGASPPAPSSVPPQPSYISLNAYPNSIAAGATATLVWGGATNVASCAGTNFDTGGSLANFIAVSPTATTAYRINCDNGAAASATLTVRTQ